MTKWKQKMNFFFGLSERINHFDLKCWWHRWKWQSKQPLKHIEMNLHCTDRFGKFHKTHLCHEGEPHHRHCSQLHYFLGKSVEHSQILKKHHKTNNKMKRNEKWLKKLIFVLVFDWTYAVKQVSGKPAIEMMDHNLLTFRQATYHRRKHFPCYCCIPNILMRVLNKKREEINCTEKWLNGVKSQSSDFFLPTAQKWW